MIYVTVKQKRNDKQLKWEDFLFNEDPKIPKIHYDETGTITRKLFGPSKEMLKSVNVPGMIALLKGFNTKYSSLFEKNKEELYDHFKIPKKTGGFRPIDAPKDELQTALRELVFILSEKFGLLYHTAAFAYVKGRCITDAVKKHQINESNWILKTDFSGFFPSTTLDFAMSMMSMLWPVSEICKTKAGEDELRKALSLGFLNNSLPQGTVLSPMLTNLIMIPIDYTLFNEFAHRRFVYTRYADDIHISCVQSFDMDEVVQMIKEALEIFHAPYEIKKEKTHYGSRKGRNKILGLSLNAENNITVG